MKIKLIICFALSLVYVGSGTILMADIMFRHGKHFSNYPVVHKIFYPSYFIGFIAGYAGNIFWAFVVQLLTFAFYFVVFYLIHFMIDKWVLKRNAPLLG